MEIERILVTGGAGFLGSAILRELAKLRHDSGFALKEIRVLDRRALGATGQGDVVSIVGDVCDPATVLAACKDVDVVVHAASLVDWGAATPQELHRINVEGTENVIRACCEVGVRGLVYTSTMDVVCGRGPVVDADETLPYPSVFTNEYARTKASAEQLVLRAHGSPRRSREAERTPQATLSTCALRPCGMFGESDPYHVANVLRVVREGKLLFRIGSGRAVFEHVYVGNVAHAHLLAMRRLLEPGNTGTKVGGQAYFITDDTRTTDFLEFMEQILEPLGYALPPRSRRAPYSVMFGVAAALEAISALCRPFFAFTPTLTRSSLRFVCHDHSFVGDKARRDLGYEPVYSEAESIQRTIEYFREP